MDVRAKQRLSYRSCPLNFTLTLAVSPHVISAVRLLLGSRGQVFKSSMKLILLVLLSAIICSIAVPGQKDSVVSVTEKSNPFRGCLLFVDDFRKPTEFTQIKRFPTTHLLRSWYRWGEPSKDKEYAQRTEIIRQLRAAGVTIGGGTSLSIVNERDIARKDFNTSWLSVNLQGTAVQSPNRQYGTLSAPGFRAYLIARLVEQARLGITELHLGESNGEIHFDDWTLGLKGDSGFVQSIRNKYKNQPLKWWKNYLGTLGEAIFKKTVRRSHFLELPESYDANFTSEWGKPDSWEGKNTKGEPAFLTFLYRKNLESFLSELRQELKTNELASVKVDVWGFADWMKTLASKPDAFISSPPDERWGLKWSTDPEFSVEKHEARFRSIMTEQIQSVAPIPVVYMIDHPKPFRDFTKLSDERQALLIKFFSKISGELGANFAFRVYSEDGKAVGIKTTEVTQAECQRRT